MRKYKKLVFKEADRLKGDVAEISAPKLRPRVLARHLASHHSYNGKVRKDPRRLRENEASSTILDCVPSLPRVATRRSRISTSLALSVACTEALHLSRFWHLCLLLVMSSFRFLRCSYHVAAAVLKKATLGALVACRYADSSSFTIVQHSKVTPDKLI